ncbi:MAG: nucleotide sugar dehydrogenase [Anaerolineae bacterium]|nr:nucleotide sugar dehydrogenase [Anaerolineae bacterium]
MLKLAVFGLGYVGCVSTACFARDGHHIIGVDILEEKVRLIGQGKSPIVEPGLAELLRAGVDSGRIHTTLDGSAAVAAASIVMVCVGTQSRDDGTPDLSAVESVCAEIGRTLAQTETYKVVVIRSTILPGYAENRLIPILEHTSGKQAGRDFGFCVNPEFLREGSALADFDDPPYTIIGELDQRSGATVAQLYTAAFAPEHVPLGVAEMVKYAGNAFHALKVVFANEIGNLCHAAGIDSHSVMNIFVKDTKLNLSPTYLRPGFAFGGSCLPKDLRALTAFAQEEGVSVPMLDAILPSNDSQLHRALDLLETADSRRVGLLGLSFKPGTDDLRESPAVVLAQRLLDMGTELTIYDREVLLSRLHGSNRAYLDRVLPCIDAVMRPTLADTITDADTIVIAKPLSAEEYDALTVLLRDDQTVIDLVRVNGHRLPDFGGRYDGICW